MNKKSGFTLIELLVVIAIIAILAAILFPVFAQAKVAAKKTADLSNVKQFALGSILYATDVDDLFTPQAGRDCNGKWDFNSRVFFPVGWNKAENGKSCSKRNVGGLGLPQNLLYPYVKSAGLYSMPGAPISQDNSWTFDAASIDKTPIATAYSFNGLLSEASSSTITSVATTPVWWPGFGTRNSVGVTYTNPFLICSNPGSSCAFNGGGATYGSPGACQGFDNHDPDGISNGSQSHMGNVSYGTVFSFSSSQNWAFADGHAKSRKTGTGDPKNDPFVSSPSYLATGFPDQSLTYIDSQCHVPIFRPDYQP